MKPLIAELVPIRINARGGVKCNRLAYLRIDQDRSASVLTIHRDYRIMVRLGESFDCPIHPRGEFILKRRPPAPDRHLIRDMGFAVHSGDAVLRSDTQEEIATLCPDRMRLAIGAPPDIAAAQPPQLGLR